MPPTPATMKGTRAPTAKKRVATAMPISPVMSSVAMIDQVIVAWLSSSGRVALHAPGIGGGAATTSDARGRGQPPLRPVGADLDDVAAAAQFLDRGLGHAVLDHEHAGARGARPERDREMLGVPRRRVDRLLQVHAGMDVAQEELRVPLVLLVAAGRTPGHVRLAVAQRHGRRQRRARTLAWNERGRMILLEP